MATSTIKAPPADSLAYLRVFRHRALVIDAVLRFKIVGIKRHPMLIQCRTDFLISHSRIRLLLLLIVILSLQFDKVPNALAELEYTARQVAPLSRIFFGLQCMAA